MYLAELDLKPLLEAKLPESRYQTIAKYPSSNRDLALLVTEDALVGEMVTGIEKLGSGLVEAVEVFEEGSDR